MRHSETLKALTRNVRAAGREIIGRDRLDGSGERFYTHYDDGEYAATVNCTAGAWAYELEERYGYQDGGADWEMGTYEIEVLGSYEIGIRDYGGR